MSERCKWPDGVESVKPDGVTELDACLYDETAVYRNVTVHVYKCERCGHVELGWERQHNTVGEICEDGEYVRHELPYGITIIHKRWTDEELDPDEDEDEPDADDDSL